MSSLARRIQRRKKQSAAHTAQAATFTARVAEQREREKQVRSVRLAQRVGEPLAQALAGKVASLSCQTAEEAYAAILYAQTAIVKAGRHGEVVPAEGSVLRFRSGGELRAVVVDGRKGGKGKQSGKAGAAKTGKVATKAKVEYATDLTVPSVPSAPSAPGRKPVPRSRSRSKRLAVVAGLLAAGKSTTAEVERVPAVIVDENLGAYKDGV